MNCPKCTVSLMPNARFCGSCGFTLEVPAMPTSPSAPSAFQQQPAPQAPANQQSAGAFQFDADGQIVTALKHTLEGREPVIGRTPKVGDRLGKFTVATVGLSKQKKYASVPIAKLENFSADDPKLTEEKRTEWLGRTYAKGVGLIEEADGAGGSCVLSAHGLKVGR